jgi:cytoskeletal protein CcmA (bactofilin family)
MSLFANGKALAGEAGEHLTLVGEEAYFHGVLTAKGSLRVDGFVEGDVADAINVEVGKKGRVKGNIAAEAVVIAGELEGDVIASRSVELISQAKLIGNIKTPSLVIGAGAFFEGSCVMSPSRSGEGEVSLRAEAAALSSKRSGRSDD